MARYLAISSQVAHGHVGLSAIVPALQALGHEVIALPTVLLSNHPGHAHVAGTRIDPGILIRMLDALSDNGRLDALDGILTGYLPTVAHVQFAAEAVRRAWAGMANTAGSYFCDPIIGDDPRGLYIDVAAANAIRDELLPLAHTLSPNRFELEWLSGQPVRDAASAVTAAARLGADKVTCATSVPGPGDTLLTLEMTADANGVYGGKGCRVLRRPKVPHGTGDLLAALLLTPMALGQAIGCVDAAISASTGSDELKLSRSARWLDADAIGEEPIEAFQ